MTTDKDTECTFNFDLEEMEKALNSGTISFPRGLTGEQRRAFIRERLKQIDDPDSLHSSA